jgi:hypothetical protein
MSKMLELPWVRAAQPALQAVSPTGEQIAYRRFVPEMKGWLGHSAAAVAFWLAP